VNPPTGRFDPELQMYAEQPHEPDPDHLRFLRWLAEHGRLEHEVAGASIQEGPGEASDSAAPDDEPPVAPSSAPSRSG
jgi:hypothetical protein